jgi:hypothetical protein
VGIFDILNGAIMTVSGLVIAITSLKAVQILVK